MGARLPERVTVYEVGPRDGLQNEARHLSTDDKLKLILALGEAGHTRIEVSSFVRPEWIPPLADADAVCSRLPKTGAPRYSALVPNLKGLERALATGLPEVAVTVSASEGHAKKNLNKTVAESIAAAKTVAEEARRQGLLVRCYVSVVWGCPFEGEVPVRQVLEVCQSLRDSAFDSVSLGDTIGIGTPLQTEAILDALIPVFGADRISLHLHDTRGTALANALAGLQKGISMFDASVAGLGGCPYAPGAAGNLATEDLCFMLQGMGISTGVNLPKLVDAGIFVQRALGRALTGKYFQAALATGGHTVQLK